MPREREIQFPANGMPRVICYCRVAQKDRVALEYQKKMLLDYCATKRYEVAQVVCETVSGVQDKNFLRRWFHFPKQKGLGIALRAAKKKKVDGVVSVSASRISRHAPTLLDFTHAL